jgi:hypothetical protein
MTTTTKNTQKKRVLRKTCKKAALRRFYLSMTKDARYDFLQAAQTTEGYIQQIYLGYCECSAIVAQRICEATDGRVGARTLRPDVFVKLAVQATTAA